MRATAIAVILSLVGYGHARADTKDINPGLIPIGDIEADALAPVVTRANDEIAAGVKVIQFRINSWGGSIGDGLDFIEWMEQNQKQGTKFVCVVDQHAASMAAVILQVCDVRVMTKRSILLFHNGSTTVKGTVLTIVQEMGFLDALNKAMAEIVCERLSITYDQYRARIEKGDWTMNWEEAQSVGAVDAVVNAHSLPATETLD